MKEYFKQQLNQNIIIDVLISLCIIGILTSIFHLDMLPMLIIYPLGMVMSAWFIIKIAREAIIDAENKPLTMYSSIMSLHRGMGLDMTATPATFFKTKSINKIKSNAWLLIIAWPTLILMTSIAISKEVVKFVKELI